MAYTTAEKNKIRATVYYTVNGKEKISSQAFDVPEEMYNAYINFLNNGDIYDIISDADFYFDFMDIAGKKLGIDYLSETDTYTLDQLNVYDPRIPEKLRISFDGRAVENPEQENLDAGLIYLNLNSNSGAYKFTLIIYIDEEGYITGFEEPDEFRRIDGVETRLYPDYYDVEQYVEEMGITD